MAEPIRIIITQGGVGGEGFTDNSPKGRNTAFGTEGQEDIGKLGFTKKEQLALAGVVLAASRKSIMNSINNTANLTGNYMDATRIKDQIGIATHIGGLALASYAAVSMLSPVGAGIAIAGLAINEIINLKQQETDYRIMVEKQNYQAERARIRAGTSLGDGSRGTNG